MSDEQKKGLDDVLYQTIVDGKFAISLHDTTDELEVFEEDQTEADNDALEVHIRSESILSKLDIEGEGKKENRYQIDKELTPDTNSSVFEVTDLNLHRTVTVKVASSDQGHKLDNAHKLIHEALIISYFDHPGIPPVYDLEYSDNQQIFCTMKKVNGAPLTELIESSSVENENSYIHKYDTINELTGIFIKVCEAMAYAHNHQVLHRNIKPEKIVIGAHGEVYIIGWDAAVDLQNDENDTGILCGTPLYMSPEQALCTEIDYRSDVYAIGATLFHALFKVGHVKRDNFDDFWSAKLEGAIDDLSEEQARSVPNALADICFKCLQKNPDERYQSVEQLLDELKAFQSGVVDSGEQTEQEVKSTLMIVVGVLFFFLAFINIYQLFQSHNSWGEPYYSETFDLGDGNPSNWQEHWLSHGGTFALDEDLLRTQDGPAFTLWFKERIYGPVAIEYDGQMLPGSQAGDLSIVYSPDIHAQKRGQRVQLYYLQNGAYDNAGSTIATPQGRLDFEPFELKHGVTYRIRAEIDGKKLRTFIDGRLICSYDLILPLNAGYIGIYAFYDEKTIDNIAIYKKPLAARSVDMKIADALLDNQANEGALERYTSIQKIARKQDLQEELTYKIGLCHYRLGEIDAAYEQWNTVTNKEYLPAINFYKWEELSKRGEYEELLRQMYYKHRSPDDLVRKNIRHQWSMFLNRLAFAGEDDLIREFINFRQVNFPESRLFSNNILRALSVVGEANRAIEMFPEQDLIVVSALIEMGEYQRVIDDYAHMRSNVATALVYSGQYQRVIDEFKGQKEQVFEAYIGLNKLDEAAAFFADNPHYSRRIAHHRGEVSSDDEIITSLPLIFDVKLAEVLDKYFAKQATLADVQSVLETANGYTKQSVSRCMQIFLLADALAHWEGRPERLKKTLDKIWREKRQTIGMRLWYGVGVILGKIDREAFLNQPRRDCSSGDYYLYEAMREDLYGSKAEAIKAYQAYIDAPDFTKYGNRAIKPFVAGRMKALR